MKKIDKAYIVRHIVRYANRKQKEEQRWYIYADCIRLFKKRLEYNNIPVEVPAPGEENYIALWKQFNERVEPYTYRFFYKICGKSSHIIPEDIACVYIEPLLNPIRFRAMYSDKNLYARLLLPKGCAPKTFLYRIAGGNIYAGDSCCLEDKPIVSDANADAISQLIPSEYTKIALKPSIDSHSGAGVMLFEKKEGIYVGKNGEILNGFFLRRYGNDFVIQEVIKQDAYVGQFCKTSVNTMRIMTYRSVEDETIHILGSVLRIGHEGSFVDNLFAGGGFAIINAETGELGKYILDEFGRKSSKINGIDFSANTFVIPRWNEAIDFAKNVAKQIRHARLCALDVVFDESGKLRLIEYNVDRFMWSFIMFSGRLPFGDRFDEVIQYCLKNKSKVD